MVTNSTTSLNPLYRQAETVNEDDLLPDPLNDRRIREVPRPPNKRLELDRLYVVNEKG